MMMRKYQSQQRSATEVNRVFPDLNVVVNLLRKQHTIGNGSEVTSRDVANLLHALGKTQECLNFMGQATSLGTVDKTHLEILIHLRSLSEKPVAPISSRVVFVELNPKNGRITMESLRKLFPNMSKVWRVLVSSSGHTALLEFASHSSARRAVDARQQVGSASFPDEPRCAWISPSVNLPPLDICSASCFPVFEITEDDSIFCPSTDWRRPRPNIPRGGTEYQFTASDLLCVLRHAGAFDDYPADLEQLIF
jgi:hypothetical protein